MTLEKIREEAIALSEKDRALLIAALLDTLPVPGIEISNEEIDRRDEELESGAVDAISHEELVRRVQTARNQ